MLDEGKLLDGPFKGDMLYLNNTVQMPQQSVTDGRKPVADVIVRP